MAVRAPLRIWSEYLLVQVLRLLFLSFPIDLNLRTAQLIGWGLSRVLPRLHQRAIENLTHAYGQSLTAAEIERLAVRSLQNFVMTGIELIQSPRLIKRFTWAKYVQFENIDDFVALAMAGGPAVLVTGHFGNFELLGQIIACFVGRLDAVVRPLDNPPLNDYMVATRSHTGLHLIFKKGAIQEAEDVLSAGRMLGFLPDQNAGSKGLFVDFFGRKASTVKSVALLAIAYDAPVIVGYCRRLGGRFRHALGVERIIRPPEWAGRDDAVTWLTQQYAAAIESCVRRHPEQYLWHHRRWKTRPREELQAAAAAI